MRTFKLLYARTVFLTTLIEANDINEAWEKADAADEDGKLGIEQPTPKDGSKVKAVDNDTSVWAMREV